MGFSLSWIGIRGKAQDVIYSELGLRATGESVEISESGFTSVLMPSGFCVIIDHDFKLRGRDLLSKLSADCDVVVCAVEEHSMVCEASQWRNGALLWRLEHDSSRGIKHLNCSGTPPQEFAGIRDENLKLQNSDNSSHQGIGVDHVFEIPVSVADKVTGYRHDGPTTGYEILEAVGPPAKQILRPGFFARLFKDF